MISICIENQNSGAFQFTGAKSIECNIRLFQREGFRLRLYRNARRDLEKFLGIAAGQVCYRSDHPLAPKIGIRKRWDVAHVNPAADDDTALSKRMQRRRNKRANGCENNCGVEFFRWLFIGTTDPFRTQLLCRLLSVFVAGPRKHEKLATLMKRYLRD